MNDTVVFQFTPSENSLETVCPAADVEQENIEKIGTDSYRIDLSEDSEITVSFGNRIRYSTSKADCDLFELLSQAEDDLRRYLQTPLRHFNLQVIFRDNYTNSCVNYESAIQKIADKKSLGDYTCKNLSNGHTAVSFSSRQTGLIV